MIVEKASYFIERAEARRVKQVGWNIALGQKEAGKAKKVQNFLQGTDSLTRANIISGVNKRQAAKPTHLSLNFLTWNVNSARAKTRRNFLLNMLDSLSQELT
jgi:hypothetical protein